MKEVNCTLPVFCFVVQTIVEGDHLSEAQAYTYKGPALEVLQLL